MKYTLPKSYANAGLQVVIPDETLRAYRTELGSTKAAVDKWLFENGHMDKAEYEAAHEETEAKKPVKREMKIDTEKAEIVKYLADHLSNNDVVNSVKIVNPNRLISFSLGDSNYEVTLVRKKKPKM